MPRWEELCLHAWSLFSSQSVIAVIVFPLCRRYSWAR